MRPSEIVLANHPLLQITLMVARAVFADKPEIKNYCSRSGVCQAQNSDEQKACTFYIAPVILFGCTVLSDTGRCLHSKANISARR
jgi:hypothetical protein